MLLRVVFVGALLFAAPAFASDWRVESVSGDAVSTRENAEPEPLDVGAVVRDGSTVVSGPATSVTLRRDDDVMSFDSNSIVEFHSGGGARATIEPKVGNFHFETSASDKGPFEVVTKWFSAGAATAHFDVQARNDVAQLDVGSGSVDLHDTMRGQSHEVKAGDSFRGEPLTKDEEAKAAEAKAQAEADKAKLQAESKRKKDSELAKKLAAKGKEGLDELASGYEGAPVPVEAPKIGLLSFLFSGDTSNLGMVLGAIAVVCVILGKVTSSVLSGVSFGMFGNALILLIGGFLGAGLHDVACPPDLVWEYEPGPGIILTIFGAFGLLVGACFLRSYLEDRWERESAAAAAALRASGRGAPRKFG